MSVNKTQTISQNIALGGFVQRIIDPLNPSITNPDQYHSCIQVMRIAISFDVPAYLRYLPDGSFIKSVEVLPTSTFTPGAALDIGKTVGASDLASSIDLTQQSITILSQPVLDNQIFRNQIQNVRPIYFTITGSPAAGAGYVLLEFLNA